MVLVNQETANIVHSSYGPCELHNNKLLIHRHNYDENKMFIVFSCFYWIVSIEEGTNFGKYMFDYEFMGYHMSQYLNFQNATDLLRDCASGCIKFLKEKMHYNYKIINFDVSECVCCDTNKELNLFKNENFNRMRKNYHEEFNTKRDIFYNDYKKPDKDNE